MGQRECPPFPEAGEDPAVLAPPTLPPQVGQAEVPGGRAHICILSTCAPQPAGTFRGLWAQLCKGHPLTSPCLIFSLPPSHLAPSFAYICIHLHAGLESPQH